LKNTAHIAVLQRESELDTKEPETHVPDLPEIQSWLFHCINLSIKNIQNYATY
jgi:hypothetical protein